MNEEKMTAERYETIQGLLTWVVFISLGIAVTFTVEYHNLLGASDLSEFGRAYLPPFFTTAWVVLALALIAKTWGSLVRYHSYYRLELANKLYALAGKIDPLPNRHH
jgi:hypothetical protein